LTITSTSHTHLNATSFALTGSQLSALSPQLQPFRLPLTADRRALKALLVFSMPVNIQFSKISRTVVSSQLSVLSFDEDRY